jgi:hypothetical protein
VLAAISIADSRGAQSWLTGCGDISRDHRRSATCNASKPPAAVYDLKSELATLTGIGARMYIELDIATIPPLVSLREPEDFGSFKVVVRGGSHAHVLPDTLRELAGELGLDPEWQRGFDGMVGYARAHGWVDPNGAIRAHVEQ